eukprot:CAMPEP_0204365316 /NCGR_PEP_ID=MMETSP0469-20131031/41823_1 /ASSEMBLY_ACC=CAM_ASM_000384 /TAXON_ID=2969 /ORGANISM="Oxyrrhis marina" /LENGTH=60 /DNA_ID=CAMNT_0051354365 /DNA_START=34 /DNA_END=213 /DNA_ORIENTATION=-
MAHLLHPSTPKCQGSNTDDEVPAVWVVGQQSFTPKPGKIARGRPSDRLVAGCPGWSLGGA